MEYQEDLNELGKEIETLIEFYKDKLPAYEIVARLIAAGVSLSLARAPNDLVGIKTVHAAIEIGISEFEENHC
jgi:hypothetical protein